MAKRSQSSKGRAERKEKELNDFDDFLLGSISQEGSIPRAMGFDGAATASEGEERGEGQIPRVSLERLAGAVRFLLILVCSCFKFGKCLFGL